MEKNTKFVMYIIDIMCIFYLCVDTIAGILISHGLPNIGQLYKTLLLFMMIFVIIQKSKNSIVVISFFFVLIFLIPLFSCLYTFSSDKQTMLVIFKILSIIVFYLYFSSYHNQNNIIRILFINYIVFLFNMLAGITGHTPAMRTAGDVEIGTRGFFHAGNEVSYTFICLTFGIMYIIKNYKYIFYALTICVSIIVATKASILSAVIIVLADFYFGLRKNKRFLFAFFSVGIISIITLYLVNNYEGIPLLKYIVFKFNQHKFGDHPILNALLSGRVSRLPLVQGQYNSSLPVIRFFFGIGFPNTPSRLEMDFLELFFYFGIFFFFFILFFYVWVVIKAAYEKNIRLVIFNLLCIATSFIVGHVVYSLMGGLFFAIINGLYLKISPNSLDIKRPSIVLKRIAIIIFK